jgi:lysyl-tRNA synthetase class II
METFETLSFLFKKNCVPNNIQPTSQFHFPKIMSNLVKAKSSNKEFQIQIEITFQFKKFYLKFDMIWKDKNQFKQFSLTFFLDGKFSIRKQLRKCYC